jgi:hypothetical protein
MVVESPDPVRGPPEIAQPLEPDEVEATQLPDWHEKPEAHC